MWLSLEEDTARYKKEVARRTRRPGVATGLGLAGAASAATGVGLPLGAVAETGAAVAGGLSGVLGAADMVYEALT